MTLNVPLCSIRALSSIACIIQVRNFLIELVEIFPAVIQVCLTNEVMNYWVEENLRSKQRCPLYGHDGKLIPMTDGQKFITIENKQQNLKKLKQT